MSSSLFKTWWKQVNVYVYFLTSFFIAFLVTYLVLVNFYYDSAIYNVDTVQYVYDTSGVCTKMIAYIPENEKVSMAEFKTCIFQSPLVLYFYDNHYDLDKDSYDDYVSKTSTFLQMIIYMYSIFIVFFVIACTCKSLLFISRSNSERFINMNQYHYRRNAQVHPISFPISPFFSRSLDDISFLFIKRDIGNDTGNCTEKEDCLICFDTLESGQKVLHHSICKKLFHTQCLVTFFEKNPSQNMTCPMCRQHFVF